MKSILFNAHLDEDHSRRLDLALDLVRSLDAHLTVLSAIPYQAVPGADPYGAAFAVMVPVWRDEAKVLRRQIEEDLANEGVSWNWIEKAGPVTDALLENSALADLIVVGQREPRFDGQKPSYTAGELALSADCPVLVLPDELKRLDLEAPALVAWDGSAEASHALRAAVPLLRHCKQVFLVSVAEKKSEHFDLPPVSGADYLARHAIAAEVLEIEANDKDVASALCDAALVRQCGLIVMGAYGRMRITERIFGGVTRAMLTKAKLPLLLRH